MIMRKFNQLFILECKSVIVHIKEMDVSKCHKTTFPYFIFQHSKKIKMAQIQSTNRYILICVVANRYVFICVVANCTRLCGQAHGFYDPKRTMGCIKFTICSNCEKGCFWYFSFALID